MIEGRGQRTPGPDSANDRRTQAPSMDSAALPGSLAETFREKQLASRLRALELAITSAAGTTRSREDIVADAEVFRKFLVGTDA